LGSRSLEVTCEYLTNEPSSHSHPIPSYPINLYSVTQLPQSPQVDDPSSSSSSSSSEALSEDFSMPPALMTQARGQLNPFLSVGCGEE
jgi:hypothetical protein